MKDAFRKNPVTMMLVIVTTAVFLVTQVLYFGQSTSSQAIFNVGGMYGEYVKLMPTQLWRLISPIFVHIGWEHYFFNILALYFVGQMAEQIWGARQFLTLYLLSGVMGNLFTLTFTPRVIAAGASTSLFGVFTAIALTGHFGRNPYLKQIGRSYQALIVLNLVFNLFTPDVSIAGHLGGLVGGALCAVFLRPAYDSNIFTKSQRQLGLAGFVGLSLILLAITYI